MVSKLSPIILFVYNRPFHTQQTLEALKKNELADESILYIYADAPKADAINEELSKIKEVRQIIKSQNWCKEIQIVERDKNWGLANNIIDGITEIVNKHGKIIVLEDDIITTPYFLKYMNESLSVFEASSQVFSVNSHMFPIDSTNAPQTKLLPYISTWGWGTWKNRWAVFQFEMSQKDYIANTKFLKQRFNLADYDYVHMFNKGDNSWGIRWYYAVFTQNGLGVFPSQSLIENIGFDGTGVNTKKSTLNQLIAKTPVNVIFESTIDLEFYSKYLDYFTIKNYGTLPSSDTKPALSKFLTSLMSRIRNV